MIILSTVIRIARRVENGLIAVLSMPMYSFPLTLLSTLLSKRVLYGRSRHGFRIRPVRITRHSQSSWMPKTQCKSQLLEPAKKDSDPATTA